MSIALVPALVGAGDALAACHRRVALPDPHAAVAPIVVEAALTVTGAGDRPSVTPIELPASMEGTNEPVASVRPVARARPARAKRPRTAVPSSAVPIAAEGAPMPIAPVPVLTPRETQLLAALAADPASSSTALGGGLGIAAGTVRKALGTLREKLGSAKDADGTALVALARERGMLTGDSGADGGEMR